MPEPQSCATVKEQLIDYVESNLSEKLQSDIAEHLDTCSTCQDEYRRMRELIEATKKLNVPEPGQEYWDTLPEKVLQEVALARKQILHGSNDTASIDSKISAQSETLQVQASMEQNSDASQSARVIPIHRDKGSSNKGSSNKGSKDAKLVMNRFRVGLSMAAAVALSVLVLLQMPQSRVQPLLHDPAAMVSGIYASQTDLVLSSGFVPVQQAANHMAFVDTVLSGRGFILGGLYVESLALLHENKTSALLHHLESMYRVLQEYEQHTVVSTLVSGLIQQLKVDGLKNSADVQRQLAVIDKSLPEMFSGSQADRSDLQMYYAGVWLSSFALSAAAQQRHLGQFMEQLDGFVNRVSVVDVPVGVEKAVVRIRELGGKAQLSQRDYRNILKEINNIRQLLS